MIPADLRNTLLDMQAREASSPDKRYPSRMVFFRRVWHRFHYGEQPDGNKNGDQSTGTANGGDSDRLDSLSPQDIPWKRLVRDSSLVTMEDYGLVLDSQFAAVAQMDRCSLQKEDQIGYNKGRAVGFVGLCCRYCGGRPGFGRFFPNTERNLEKTSARDTMVSHISLFCKQVPDDVRSALLSLKRIESSKDGSATMKKLIYGSGKLFHHRVWMRLHSPETSGVAAAAGVSNSGAVAALSKKEIAKAVALPPSRKQPGISVLASAKRSILHGNKKPAASASLPRPPSNQNNEQASVASHSSATSASHSSPHRKQSGDSDDNDDDDDSSSDGSELAPTTQPHKRATAHLLQHRRLPKRQRQD